MDWTERFICNDNTPSVNMAEQVPIHHNKWQYQKQTDSNVFYLSFIGYAIYTKGRQSQFLWWYMLSFLDVAFLLTGNNDVFFFTVVRSVNTPESSTSGNVAYCTVDCIFKAFCFICLTCPAFNGSQAYMVPVVPETTCNAHVKHVFWFFGCFQRTIKKDRCNKSKEMFLYICS